MRAGAQAWWNGNVEAARRREIGIEATPLERTGICGDGRGHVAGERGVGSSTDPFQSAPVAAPAPKPRPQPQPQPRFQVQPDPPMAAPPTVAPAAPALPPSAAIWARVRQAAQVDGVNVPLASSPPFDPSGASPELRGLVGAWGPGVWQGGDDKLILIVLSATAASVHGVVARGTGTDWTFFDAPASGSRFTIHIQTTYASSGLYATTRTLDDENWQFDLRSDGRVYGTRASGATIALPRLQ